MNMSPKNVLVVVLFVVFGMHALLTCMTANALLASSTCGALVFASAVATTGSTGLGMAWAAGTVRRADTAYATAVIWVVCLFCTVPALAVVAGGDAATCLDLTLPLLMLLSLFTWPWVLAVSVAVSVPCILCGMVVARHGRAHLQEEEEAI